MARASTTSDVFNAVAEYNRRAILAQLKKGERSVNQLVDHLELTQPQVSKHLRVLREVGLVHTRGAGQQRLYSLNVKALKPIHQWIKEYERFWNESFDRLDTYITTLKKEQK